MATSPDVAVIGGGVIGLTAAYVLANEGHSVELRDRTDLGTEASWAGAGIIPPGNPDRAATPADRLRAIGSARFPAFAAELRNLTGIDPGYRKCGGIEFLPPHDADVLPLWDHEGIRFARLGRDDLRHLEPIGEVPGDPYHLPDCAQVRNPWLLRALIAACEHAGVRLRPHTPAGRWEFAGGRVTGLRLTTDETVRAGHYLTAAGAWTGFLLEPLGVRLPVRPVRGQIVLLNADVPRHILMVGKRYVVPRGDSRVLIGSTEEPEAGFEKQTTPAAVAGLIRFAARTVPVLAAAAVEKTWAGLRPGSPDGLPYIGRVPGHDNVLVAAGHFRAGIQLSIGTAQLLADLVHGRPPVVPPDAFRLDRPPGAGPKPAFRS
ncbi:MAG: FAD-dependent oxidoreductase [Gemmataceae bacterium]|nr:FAD-dependent oxidoreductase [Gemmataceae bacterium]